MLVVGGVVGGGCQCRGTMSTLTCSTESLVRDTLGVSQSVLSASLMASTKNGVLSINTPDPRHRPSPSGVCHSASKTLNGFFTVQKRLDPNPG